MRMLVSMGVLVLVVASASTAEAGAWRGIEPMRSTREDVIRILGPSSDNGTHSKYRSEDEDVTITYVDENDACKDTIPVGTVLTVTVEPTSDRRASDLGFDIRRFRRFNPSSGDEVEEVASDPNDGDVGYIDEENGVVFRTVDGIVAEICFIASAVDTRWCPEAYEDPEGFVAQPVGCGGLVCVRVTADRTIVLVGESINLQAVATDSDGDALTYTWTSWGGSIVGEGPNVVLDTSGVAAPATITVRVSVNDGFNPSVNCQDAIIHVTAPPNECPVVGLTADHSSVHPGQIVMLSANADDPDDSPQGLTYEWWASGGSIKGEGATASLDTSDVKETTRIEVRVRVRDGDYVCRAMDEVTVKVVHPPPGCRGYPPLRPVLFAHESSGLDSDGEAVLKDYVLYLRANPHVSIVLDGHNDPGERRDRAQERALAVREYFAGTGGIDESRIVVRAFFDSCPSPEGNRRVELFILSENFTNGDIQKDCSNPPATAADEQSER